MKGMAKVKTTALRLLGAAGWIVGAAACGLGGASLPGAPSAGPSDVPAATSLPSGTWRLVSLQEKGQAEVPIAQPERFTAEFAAGGRVHLRADCNRCAGSYNADGGRLSVGAMACTRAFCTETAPLDETFTVLVGRAQTWVADGDRRLELSSDAGRLRFVR